MISPLSAAKLAYTKLKTRRLRLAISLLITSLLFSILIAATIIQAGFFTSFNKFSNEGLAGRYIIAGNGSPPTWGETFGIGRNLTLIVRAESLQNQLIEEKTNKAEELGLEYSPEWDKAVFPQPDGSKFLGIQSEIGKQVIAEHRESLKPADRTSFRKQIEHLSPQAIYQSVRIQQEYGKLLYIRNGKEPTAAELANYELQRQGFGGITQYGVWQLMDSELLSPFVFEGQSLDIGKDSGIPVVAPSYAIEQELGLEPLASDASPEQKRERIKLLRSKAAGMTFEICYRNAPSLELFNKAVAQQSDKAANSGREGYEAPDLLYSLLESPCSLPVIESDTRSEADKEKEANWQEFNKIFNQPEPVNQLLRFRIVGIKRDYNPDTSGQGGGNFTPEQIFDTAFNTSAGQGWLTPLSVQAKNPTVATLFKQDPGHILGEGVTYFAEFSSADDARLALLENTCNPAYGTAGAEGGLLGTKLETNNDTPSCSRDGRQFTLQPFGSNSIVIDQFKDLTQRILLIAAVSIAALAAIILMGMVGRIIADSRRETAIFRAVGATRLSIMQVYFTYIGFLVLCIVGLSVLFGFLAAYVLNARSSPDFSIVAAVAFLVKDLSQQFIFIGLDWFSLGFIVLIIIVASYLAATIPILRSVRRNPMSDMREE
jgi:hypothetical protein